MTSGMRLIGDASWCDINVVGPPTRDRAEPPLLHSSSTAVAGWHRNQDTLKIPRRFWSTKKKFLFISFTTCRKPKNDVKVTMYKDRETERRWFPRYFESRGACMAIVETSPERKSLEDVHGSIVIPPSGGKRQKLRRLFTFLGPAYLVSVGYMDPGNWATDLEGGARFGYTLIWVLLMSNLMAILLQTLAARLGVVTKHDLAQACRESYPKPVCDALWVLCEIAIAACDLAEVLGAAIGLHLLFGIPLVIGVSLTALDTR